MQVISGILFKHIFLIIGIVLLFVNVGTLYAQNTRVIVTGVQSKIDDPEWNNQLVSQGLAQILEQELSNSGQFIIVETNPEIIDKLNRRFNEQKNTNEFDSIKSISAQNFPADAYAYAVVKDFSVSRNRIQIGPFCSGNTSVEVKINVHLIGSDTNHYSSLGLGKSTTKSLGAFFQIQNNQVYFDATTVGQAAKEAVQDAVQSLKSSCDFFSPTGS
ncbi:MAG: hypothetical protein U5L00_17985 [Desulfovermiculus sp.]|nr:hypothetical protein [Desulfovermiculus sp.]